MGKDSARTRSRRVTRGESGTAEASVANKPRQAKHAQRLAPPRWWAVAISIIAAAVAFGGALRGPFQFDDVAAIVRNPTIDRVWPLDVPLNPPPRTAVSGRPVVNYSLAVSNAINNALGISSSAIGLPSSEAAGFRVLNILIHLLCGLLLFGIIRRTMRGPHVANDWSAIADPVAGIVVMLWLVHPLNTETVDYVIQRTELLVSLFYLTTLYAALRAWDAARPRARTLWYGAAVVASLLGMWSKEVMVSVPFAVILYDRAFRAESWRSAFAARRWFYVALCATLIPLAITVASGARADSVGFSQGITWYQYLYSQGWAIARYVRLAVIPVGLTYDYGESAIQGVGGALGLVALAAVAIATIVLWIRGRRELLWLAFLSSWFFLLLAPSSSFVPIRTEIAAERRMYLALVPIIVLVVLGLERLRRRSALRSEGKTKWLVPAVVGAIGLALTIVSARRSLLYADAEELWSDAVSKTPANPRAYDNLAAAIIRKDSSRADEAVRVLRQAISVDSTYVTAYNNIAAIELQRGNTAAARDLLEHALRINPNYIDATERLGALQVKAGDTPTAISSLERVVATRPTEEALSNLALAYMSAGRADDAKTVLGRLIAMNPHRADALSYLAAMYSEEGHPDQALGYIEAAVREGSTTPQSYALLSLTYAQLGRPEESAKAASVAGAQPGVDAGIYMQLGRAMMMSQRAPDAERFFARATELAPNDPEAITRLGIAKAASGDGKGAVGLFRRALSIAPGYEPAARALAAAPASLK